jgi:hypothetical protein
MIRFTDVLDTLLPGEEGFPLGSTCGIEPWLEVRADRFAVARDSVLAALPANFQAFGTEAREEALAVAETAVHTAFATLLTGVYTAYYTSPDVRAVIATKTGYAAGAPQPGGYAMAPFDPAIVAVPAARAPCWRKVDP